MMCISQNVSCCFIVCVLKSRLCCCLKVVLFCDSCHFWRFVFYQASGPIPQFLWVLAACGSQLPSALKIISGSKALAFPKALCAHLPTLAACRQQLTDKQVQKPAPSSQGEVHFRAVHAPHPSPQWDQAKVRLQLRPQSHLASLPVWSCFPLSFSPESTHFSHGCPDPCPRLCFSGT